MSAVEDPFNLGNHQEDHEKNYLDKDVSNSHYASLKIQYADQMEVFRVDDENLKRQSGVFKLSGIFPSGGESRYRRATEEEFRVVPIAKNGGLVVTILRTAGRYTDRMRDVLRALYVMSVHPKDALLSRLRRA